MLKTTKKAAAFKLAFAAIAGFTSATTAPTIFAQDEVLIEEVVVTGSRIRNPNLTQSSCVC